MSISDCCAGKGGRGNADGRPFLLVVEEVVVAVVVLGPPPCGGGEEGGVSCPWLLKWWCIGWNSFKQWKSILWLLFCFSEK